MEINATVKIPKSAISHIGPQRIQRALLSTAFDEMAKTVGYSTEEDFLKDEYLVCKSVFCFTSEKG